VEKGGNIIVIPSDTSNFSSLNTFLANFGTIQFKTISSISKKITKINFKHPLFSAVFEKKIDNFQYPTTKKSFEVNSSSPSVLSFDDQNPFLVSMQKGIANIYVFAAPINKLNSNFQNSPLIVPTFYNMAKNGQKTGVNAIIIGETQPFIAEVKLTKDEILTVKNDSEKFIPVQQILNNKVKMTFNDTPTEAGNFGIFKTENFLQNISFNYNRTESDLALVNEDAASEFTIINDVETVFNTIHTNRTDTQIWKWFVIFTLVFLALEFLIQKFVK
jgi:hypothetical protein